MYKMEITTENDEVILSPIIAPNNPKHDYKDIRIRGEIHKTGKSMMRRLNLKSYRVVIS